MMLTSGCDTFNIETGEINSKINGDDTVVTVAHAQYDLWSSVVAGDNVGRHHEASTRSTRQTKIKNLQRTVALHHNVGRLQILQW